MADRPDGGRGGDAGLVAELTAWIARRDKDGLPTADIVRAAADRLTRLIDVAGEALGTDPALRSEGCVDALATAYADRGRELEAQADRLTAQAAQLREARAEARLAAVEGALREIAEFSMDPVAAERAQAALARGTGKEE